MMKTLHTDSEVNEMKSSLRALQHKRDKISLEIAETLEVSGFYVLSQLNLNDPRVQELRDQLYAVESKMDKIYWKIEEAEAIRDNEYPRYLAKKQCTKFLGALGDKAANSFLKQHGLTTITLVEAVLENPDFFKEHEGPNWLPILKVEDNMVFVQTIRGIEPARKANIKCSDVKAGDLALCRSVHNHLFMIDYVVGVEA